MKILAIRGCNIASLEGEFEIDFTKEPLCSNGIYTITGPTGAGKSTILDVLCVALYNKTPRLLRASGKDIRDVGNEVLRDKSTQNLLRKGCASGYAEVDFVAVNGNRFRANWSIRRAGNNPRKRLQNPTIKLYDLNDLSDLSDTNSATLERIQQLVGLTYDQFSRAVLLAQGEFSAFLKAGDSERAELLEKLTGTGIYSRISSKVYEEWDQAKKNLEKVELLLNNQNLLSEEAFRELKEKFEEKEKSLKQIEAEFKSLETEMTWFRQEENLVSQITKSQERLQAMEGRQIALTPTYEKLATIEALKGIEKDFMLLQDKSLQLRKDKDSFQTLSMESNALIVREKEALEEVEKVKGENTLFLESEPAFRKQLQKARELDVRIRTLSTEIENLLSEREQARKDVVTVQENVKEVKNSIEHNTLEIKEKTQWIEKNKATHLLSEHLGVITQSLALLSGHRKEYNDLIANESQLKEKQLKSDQTQSDLQATLHKQKGEIEARIPQEESIRRQIDSIDIADLKNKLIAAEKELAALGDLSITWNSLYPLMLTNRQNSETIGRNKKTIEANQVTLKESEEKLNEVNIRLKQTVDIEAEYRLRVSHNVEEMRAALKSGEACPVCGSKEHPFDANHSPEFQSALSTINKKKEELENQRYLLQQEITRIETRQQELTQNNLRLTDENRSHESEIGKYQSDLNANQHISLLDGVEEKEKNTFLRNKREASAVLQEDFKKQIRFYEELTLQLKQSQLKTQELQNKLFENQKELIRMETELKGYGASLKEYECRKNDKLRQLEEEKLKVDAYFTTQQWWNDWKKSSNGFLDSLNRQVEEWKREQSRLENAVTQEKVLDGQLKSVMASEQKAVMLLEERQKKVVLKTNELDQLKEDRKQFFSGDNVDNTEERFDKQKRDLNTKLERCKEASVSISNELSRKRGEAIQLEENLLRLRNETDELEDGVEKWIQQYNETHDKPLDNSQMKDFFAIPLVRIDNWRKECRELEDEMTSLKATLETHKESLNSHRENRNVVQQSKEEVAVALQMKIEQRKCEETELNNYGYQIREQQKKVQEAVTLQKEQSEKRAVFLKWSQLNEAIGQRDGAKFRMFAQGYTLDVLLRNANLHIRNIAPRYNLQRIPESLSLQVIDRDMCDNVRSVHSLSGGETFLVSLALALGLSSLSSRQMNIESLFIDEGFGSLDQETLSAAMDALESLRLQGRKVGVITHVREMTERIAAKVVVRKKNNGASEIEVI